MRGLFEITRERVPQIGTFINSKLKSIVLNGLRRGTESGEPTHCLRETGAERENSGRLRQGGRGWEPNAWGTVASGEWSKQRIYIERSNFGVERGFRGVEWRGQNEGESKPIAEERNSHQRTARL